jgi:hypothetical protein
MDYIAEIKKLPSEVQDVLMSSFGASINLEISKKYNLDDSQANLFIDFTNDLYLKNLKIDNLEGKIISDLKLSADQAHSLALDIAGLKLLVADDYFKGEILNYLAKNNGDLTSYGQKVMEEKVAIEKEKKEELDLEEEPLNEGSDKEIKKSNEKSLENRANSRLDELNDQVRSLEFIEGEKKSAISLFRENLLDTLNSPADFEEVIQEYNESLIDLLHDVDFKKDLENALYSNQEQITESRIHLEGREVDGTVSNWLKDFIKTNGSEFFSGVALAQYLSNSANIKNISPLEKHLISQLLKLYRNLSFFPDSMGNLPTSSWQIVPFDRMTQERVALKMVPPIETPVAKPIFKPNLTPKTPIKEVIKETPVTQPIITKAIEESLNNAPINNVSAPVDSSENILDEITELNKEIANYPENSLEYRALKQEIEHFKKSKNFKI